MSGFTSRCYGEGVFTLRVCACARVSVCVCKKARRTPAGLDDGYSLTPPLPSPSPSPSFSPSSSFLLQSFMKEDLVSVDRK